MRTNRRVVRIEWGDCDPAGIIFYPRYFALFDASTQILFERAGCGLRAMQKQYGMIGFPLVDARARFLVPCGYGEEVAIESAISEFRRSSFQVEHRLYKGDALAVEGSEIRVWVAPSMSKPGQMEAKPIPPEVVKRFADSES